MWQVLAATATTVAAAVVTTANTLSTSSVLVHNSSNITSKRPSGRNSCSPLIPGVLLAVGLLENTFSIFVLSRRSLRQLPLRASLLMLCVASLVALLVSMPRYMLICMAVGDIRSSHPIFCRFHRAITDTTVQLTNTLVAFISLERFMAIMFPYMIPQHRAAVERRGLLIIVFCCIIFNSHYFFTINYLQYPKHAYNGSVIILGNNTNVTGKINKIHKIHCHVKKLYQKWVVLCMSLVQTYIPFLVVLVTSISIIVRLYSLKRTRANSGPAVRSKKESEKQAETALINNSSVEPEPSPSHDANGTVDESPSPKTSRLSRQNTCSSREAKAAQLILIITISFIFCNAPYEIYQFLTTYRLVQRRSVITYRKLWTFLMYLNFSYQLLVFPIYIVYHPIIRGQLVTWFSGVKQRVSTSRGEAPTFE